MSSQPTTFSDKQAYAAPDKDALQIINKANGQILGWVDGTGQAQGTLAAPETDVLNVLDFGATGNGITDDTAAVQAALNAAKTAATATVFFPAGTYTVSQIVLTTAHAGVRLLGSNSSYGSSHRAQFKASGTSDMFTNYGSPNLRNIQFENVSINGNNTATSGIYLDTCISPVIKNCEFINFATNTLPASGLKGGGCLYPRVEGCLFHNGTGRSIDLQNGYSSLNASTYYGSNDGWFQFNNDSTSTGMRVGGDNYFLNNDFEMTLNTPALAALDISDASSHAGNAKTVVTGNYFECVKGTCAIVRAFYGCIGQLSGTVSDNTMFGGTAAAGGIAIDFSDGYMINMMVSGNSIRNWGTGIKWIQGNGGGSPTILGNYIESTSVTTATTAPQTTFPYASTNTPPQFFVLRGGIYMLNAPWVGTQVRMPSGTTAYDLSAGSQIYAQDTSPTTVTGVTNAVIGTQFYITASTANTTLTNGSAAFVLKAGANYTMAAGQTLAFIVTADGIVREIGASA